MFIFILCFYHCDQKHTLSIRDRLLLLNTEQRRQGLTERDNRTVPFTHG